jgi:hypothetical protein
MYRFRPTPVFLTKVSLKSNSLYWNDPINSETLVILGPLALAFNPNYPLTLIKFSVKGGETLDRFVVGKSVMIFRSC